MPLKLSGGSWEGLKCLPVSITVTSPQLGNAAMAGSQARVRVEQVYFMPLRTRRCAPSHNRNKVMSLLGRHKAQEADGTGFLGTGKRSCLLTRAGCSATSS